MHRSWKGANWKWKDELWLAQLRIVELKHKKKLWSSSQIANGQFRDYLVGLSNYDDLIIQNENDLAHK